MCRRGRQGNEARRHVGAEERHRCVAVVQCERVPASLLFSELASPIAEEMVARYRHAQLSAVKIAGDINARVADDASLDELLAKTGEIGEAQADPRADYRLGGCAPAAGVENRGRLDRGELKPSSTAGVQGLKPRRAVPSGLSCARAGRWCGFNAEGSGEGAAPPWRMAGRRIAH